MIFGAHTVVYSKDAEADRAFFRDILGFDSVDAGHDWLIFALPPGEAAFHPSDSSEAHELYLMCDDVEAEIAALTKKGVVCSPLQEEVWGTLTSIRRPGGGNLGLYQPKHPTAIGVWQGRASDDLPGSVARPMQFENGTAVGTSDVWQGGQYCKILTAAGIVGCGIFDLEVAAEFGEAIAIARGTPDQPLVEPEDLLDAVIVGLTPQAEALGAREGMTGREAVETFLAAR